MKCCAFDLDDTLYSEQSYVVSAYRAIEDQWGITVPCGVPIREAFAAAAKMAGVGENDIVNLYRSHTPKITLYPGVIGGLNELKKRGYELAIITDGRGSTQRAKLKALGLDGFINPDMIFISEEVGCDKLSGKIFDKLPRFNHKIYVGDNPAKDFQAAIQRGWRTFCLKDKGSNIHPQSLEGIKPTVVIGNISDLLNFL